MRRLLAKFAEAAITSSFGRIGRADPCNLITFISYEKANEIELFVMDCNGGSRSGVQPLTTLLRMPIPLEWGGLVFDLPCSDARLAFQLETLGETSRPDSEWPSS